MPKTKIAKDKKDKKPAEELNQSRNWCFTDFQFLNWKEIYNEYSDIIRYVCFGKEIAPTTGTKHLQGWIQFTTKRTMGGVKRICKSKQLSLRPCYGDEYSNDVYCSKDGKFTHFGKFLAQGARTDLEMIRKLIADETPMKQIADDYFDTWCRNYKAFEKYREMITKDKTKEFRKVEVEIIYGETGQGKTRRAMEEATYKIEGDNLQWWDGYNGDKCILIDEYSNQLPITKLLNILDGYQLRLPIKGGHTYANWNKVYITTNVHWDDWHPNAKMMHRDALARRCTKWINLLDPADVGPQGNTSLRANDAE